IRKSPVYPSFNVSVKAMKIKYLSVNFLKAVAAICLAGCTLAPDLSSQDHYPTAVGLRQSPVDLPARACQPAPNGTLHIHYGTDSVSVTDSGHAFQVACGAGNFTSF